MAPTGPPGAERGDNLSGRAGKTEKGSWQGAPFRFGGFARTSLGPPDVARRPATARLRGWTLPLRSSGRFRPQAAVS